MCKPASMIIVHKNVAKWSETTDSHHEIITEFGIREVDARGDINIVPVEMCPEGGNLSIALSKWKYGVDYQEFGRELPDWYDAEKSEAAARAALPMWAESRLKGWKLKEAFKPINPLKQKQDKSLDKAALLKEWASVRDSVMDSVWASVWASVRDSVRDSVVDSVWASVWASVRDSVWASVRDSVWASVWDSVGDSVGDSVWDSVWDSVYGYIGSLFHNIKNWKYTDSKNPWASIRKLWLGGYVPSFDGKTWRLHAGLKAKVVFEITAEELRAS